MDAAAARPTPAGLPDDVVGDHLRADDDGARLIALAAAAGEVLSASVEPEIAIRSLARLPVPDLADWSMVTVLDDDGVLRDVDTWHRDPLHRPATVRFSEHRLDGIRDKSNGVTQAAASRNPVYVREGVADLAISRLASAEAIDAMRFLAPSSAAFVPLLHAGRLVGVLTLYRGPDRPPLSPAEETAVEIIGRRAAIALLNAMQMRQQRDVSEELQRSMLTRPVSPDHLEIVARYLPADESVQIGGDWYDAFDQQDGRTVLVIGDVVGHDITSAAAMGQLRNIIRGVAVATGAAPAELLDQVDRVMATLRMTTIATALVMRTDVLRDASTTVRLQWSNAGHPPPVVSDASGRVRQLDGHDLLLGVSVDTPRAEQTVDLAAGSTVLMFTDGLVERRGESLDDGLARLREKVAHLAGLPLDELVAGILPEQHEDDIAVLAVRFTPERRGEVPTGSETMASCLRSCASREVEGCPYDIRGPVSARAAALEAEGHRILKLNIGNPQPFGFDAPAEILQDVIAALPSSAGYSDSRASSRPVARSCTTTSCRRLPDDRRRRRVIGNGVSELIQIALQALLDNGDGGADPRPGLPAVDGGHQPRGWSAGALPVRRGQRVNPDLRGPRVTHHDRTKVIVVINPNNPTGAVYSRETLAGIADLAASTTWS